MRNHSVHIFGSSNRHNGSWTENSKVAGQFLSVPAFLDLAWTHEEKLDLPHNNKPTILAFVPAADYLNLHDAACRIIGYPILLPPITPIMARYFLSGAIVSVVLALLSAVAAKPHGIGRRDQGSGKNANGHWVDIWTTMPQLTEFPNLPLPPFVSSRPKASMTTTYKKNRTRLAWFSLTQQFVKLLLWHSQVRRFASAFRMRLGQPTSPSRPQPSPFHSMAHREPQLSS